MKMRYKLFSTVVSLFLLSSCGGILDIAPDGKISLDDVWKDNDKVGAYLNTCYDYCSGGGGLNNWYFQTNPYVSPTDDVWDCDAEVETGLSHAVMYNGAATSNSHPQRADYNGAYRSWASLFEGVRKCNMFLSHIDAATVKSESNRARWKAEAHGLRAWMYCELIRYYGALPPFMTSPLMFNDDFSFVKKYNGAENASKGYRILIDKILADIDTALQEKSIPWRATSGSEGGRITKALLVAMQSRYTLYAASPVNADVNGKQAMTWEEAYQYNHAALQKLRDNGYKLYTKCANPATYNLYGTRGQVKWDKGAAAAAALHEYFCSSMEYSSSPIDQETIWQTRGNGGAQPWVVNGVGFQNGYRCGMVPTQELVDQYENVKYNSSTATESYPVVDLDKPYVDHKHLIPNYNSANPVYNPLNPYVDRDPRFYVTVIYNECIREAFWLNEETDGRTGMKYAGNALRKKTIWTNKEDMYTGIHATQRDRTRTGYYMNKYLHPTSGQNADQGSQRYKLFRLAEIILNTAECAINSGRAPEGMELINEIRDRAGMPALPTNVNATQALTYLKHERRIEFAAEETRWDDMRRWCKPNGDMKDMEWSTAMEISWRGDDANGEPIYTYTRKNIRSSARQCYSNKWLWVPINLSEQNKLGTLTGAEWQNPGW